MKKNLTLAQIQKTMSKIQHDVGNQSWGVADEIDWVSWDVPVLKASVSRNKREGKYQGKEDVRVIIRKKNKAQVVTFKTKHIRGDKGL